MFKSKNKKLEELKSVFIDEIQLRVDDIIENKEFINKTKDHNLIALSLSNTLKKEEIKKLNKQNLTQVTSNIFKFYQNIGKNDDIEEKPVFYISVEQINEKKFKHPRLINLTSNFNIKSISYGVLEITNDEEKFIYYFNEKRAESI
ncbi:MAG: hypothetical protein UR73_C0001G0004 [candidate division WS6 bacterium GW2011_GWF1_35_23]|uniref:Uncharacterized protein n=1 Tax=candidate division WS6 bacterium GW2011_GWF1_35_23 TaxID=1619097 RepID=A0A0G0C9G0_9BACT|nr:MAG: hypothetical protein UR73_C0001G0004 [candidate division WS6 bacterium GW2011_GWF1_35_23]